MDFNSFLQTFVIPGIIILFVIVMVGYVILKAMPLFYKLKREAQKINSDDVPDIKPVDKPKPKPDNDSSKVGVVEIAGKVLEAVQ